MPLRWETMSSLSYFNQSPNCKYKASLTWRFLPILNVDPSSEKYLKRYVSKSLVIRNYIRIFNIKNSIKLSNSLVSHNMILVNKVHTWIIHCYVGTNIHRLIITSGILQFIQVAYINIFFSKIEVYFAMKFTS